MIYAYVCIYIYIYIYPQVICPCEKVGAVASSHCVTLAAPLLPTPPKQTSVMGVAAMAPGGLLDLERLNNCLLYIYINICIHVICLVVTTPLKNLSWSVGVIIPNGKIKNDPNH